MLYIVLKLTDLGDSNIALTMYESVLMSNLTILYSYNSITPNETMSMRAEQVYE